MSFETTFCHNILFLQFLHKALAYQNKVYHQLFGEMMAVHCDKNVTHNHNNDYKW